MRSRFVEGVVVAVRAVNRSSMSLLVLFILLIAAAVLAASGCGPAPPAGTGGGAALYPLMIQGKYGYADATGKIVIPRQYTQAWPFHEGLAVAVTDDGNGAWAGGYIDQSGKMVIKPYGGEFSEGLAGAMDDNSAFRFVDRTGRTVIPGPFGMVSQFQNGLAVVSAWPDPDRPVAWPGYGIIDTTGRWVVPAQYEQMGEFHEGLIAVLTKDGLWGYIDVNGKMVIAPRFPNSEESGGPRGFSDGLAAVRTAAGWGFVDHSGAWVISPQFASLGDFSEGWAAAKAADGRWGFIDRTGKWVIPAQFSFVAGFYQGLSLAGSGGLRGVIDRTGSWVIQPQFKQLDVFSEGLAAAQTTDGLWGYIDETGKMVVTAEYCAAGQFKNGIAVVRPVGNTEYLIDRTGKRLTPSAD